MQGNAAEVCEDVVWISLLNVLDAFIILFFLYSQNKDWNAFLLWMILHSQLISLLSFTDDLRMHLCFCECIYLPAWGLFAGSFVRCPFQIDNLITHYCFSSPARGGKVCESENKRLLEDGNSKGVAWILPPWKPLVNLTCPQGRPVLIYKTFLQLLGIADKFGTTNAV